MTKRNKLLTVLFSFLPGAGHMFIGFMKMGLSFMTIFFGIIAIVFIFRADIILILLPIIWFYSFFDCINKTFPTDEATIIEDRYVLFPESLPNFKIFAGKQRVVLGIGAILIGVYFLADNVLSWVRPYLTDIANNILSNFMWRFPQLVIAVVIIIIGLVLIAGKKKEIDER